MNLLEEKVLQSKNRNCIITYYFMLFILDWYTKILSKRSGVCILGNICTKYRVYAKMFLMKIRKKVELHDKFCKFF